MTGCKPFELTSVNEGCAPPVRPPSVVETRKLIRPSAAGRPPQHCGPNKSGDNGRGIRRERGMGIAVR
jgi:hypothetical protein